MDVVDPFWSVSFFLCFLISTGLWVPPSSKHRSLCARLCPPEHPSLCGQGPWMCPRGRTGLSGDGCRAASLLCPWATPGPPALQGASALFSRGRGFSPLSFRGEFAPRRIYRTLRAWHALVLHAEVRRKNKQEACRCYLREAICPQKEKGRMRR